MESVPAMLSSLPVDEMAPAPMAADCAVITAPASRSSPPLVKPVPATVPIDSVPMANVPVSATSPVSDRLAALAGPAITVKPVCETAMLTLLLTPGAIVAGVAPEL
jgi:hypothetical protein